MRHIYRQLLSSLISASCFLIFGPRAIAQTSDTGLPPFGSFHGSSIDVVSLENGNLHIEIPLYPVHRRAATSSTVNFVYDIAGYQIDYSPVTPTTFEWRVGPSPHQLTGWHALDSFPGQWYVFHDVVGKTCTYVTQSGTFTNHYNVHTNYALADTHGTTHPFEVRHVDQPPSGCQDLTGNQNTGVALDGSGYTITIGANAYSTTIGTPNDKGPLNGNSFVTPAVTTTNQNDASGNLATSTFAYKDSNGTPQQIRVDFVTVSIQTHFCTVFNTGGWPCYEYSSTSQLPQKLTLPSGRFYQFTWSTDGNADLLRIDLPTGGYFAYSYGDRTKDLGITYAGGTDGGRGVGSPTHHYLGRRLVTSRTVSDGSSANTWTYSGTVRDPLGNEEVHTFTPMGDPPNPPRYETQIQYYQGTAASGTLLKTVVKEYASEASTLQPDAIDHGQINVRLARVTTILENGLQTKAETDYEMFQQAADPAFAVTVTRLNPIQKREYAYGSGAPGPLLRRTDYTYLHTGNQNYISRNIVRQVATTTVYDGGGTQVAKTVNEYDNYSHSGQPMLASSAVQHDPAYSTTFIYRGNLTAISRWRNSDGAMLATTNQYDDAGNLLSAIDPLGHKTSYDYTDSWSNTVCVPSGQAKITPTRLTNALNQVTTKTYNSCTITLASETDPNSKTTSYTYDFLDRLTSVATPDGGRTSHAYDDSQLLVTSNSLKAAGSAVFKRQHYDGLGRVKQSEVCEDGTASCASSIKVDTGFDALGQTVTVSNPYRTSNDPGPTNGVTTTQYDATGRITKIIPPDGTVSANNVLSVYSGNCVTATDEAGKTLKTCTDALGRLVEVDEPTPWPATAGGGSATTSGTEKSVPGSGATPGTATVTISGVEQTAAGEGCSQRVCSIYDIGGVQIVVNGFSKIVNYGQGSTASNLAAALASAFNGDANSPVTASSGSGVVTLTSKVTGTASNYSLTARSWTNDPTDFSGPSFAAVASGANLTGGNTGGPPIYDTGSAWVTVNGFQAIANYSQNSTSASVAAAIASVLNTNGSSPVSAAVSGNTIVVTAKTSGAATNYTLSSGSSTSQPGSFSSPSFSVSVSGSSLTGGVNANPGSLASPSVTLYTYDTLDNLTCAVQKGFDSAAFSTCAAAPAAWRPRAFTYNSLSNMLSAQNPESGLVNYSYDNDGNLITKNNPAPNQVGSTRVTANYSYDPLHRMIQKSFSDGTATVKYGYDAVAPSGCTLPALTINNGIGRRTGMCDGGGAEAWSYDITANVGWKVTDARTTNGVTKSTIVQSNLIGSSASLTYPSGRTVTFSYDLAGRPASAVDSTGPINYTTAANYAPHGVLASLTNGASLVSTLYFNKRLQPCRISVKSSGTAPASCTAAGAGNVLDFSFNFSLGASDNGNVAAIVNNRDATRSENFSYDALNRLATAQTQTSGVTIPNPNCWALTFGYDAWSNLLTSQISGPAGCSEPLALSTTVSTLNRLLTNTVAGQTTNYCFDTAGNLVHTVTAPASCPATGPYQSTYDAENHLTSAGGVTYSYDGDGRRVKKSNGKLYWYGLGNDPIDETDLAGNTNNTSFKEYVFFAGKRVARRDYLNTVNYYFSDYLNTTRVVANASGTLLDDSDFYPFGGERSVASSSGNSYKFTGKEHDPESGFDNFGARFMSNTQGRFNSADPGSIGMSLAKPQMLNRYTYAGNNPLRFTDPDGKYPREQHEFFTFWLAAVAQKYNGRSDAAQLAAGAGKADNFWNATTGLFGLGLIVNYKKHFGTPPKDIGPGIKGGFDAHLVEDHKGPDAPHARGALYHIYSNIMGRSVDTADSSFGGFRELGKMLGIPEGDPVFSELEDVRKYANSMNAAPFQVIYGGVPYGKGPEKSWTLIETKQFGDTTVNLYKPPDNSQEWHDFFLPGEDPVEHERKRICAQGDPAACKE